MQDVVFKGKTYEDVPAINLPNGNGNLVRFTDVSDTTAIASDVTSGKYFYNASGVRTAGSSSGGGGGVDTSSDTVTAATLFNGVTAHDATGAAITGEYVAPTERTSSDVTVSGNTVTVAAGAYASSVSKSVASGSATTPATTVTANPTISVSSSGLITATASATESVTPTVSAGYVLSGTAGTITVSGSNTEQLTTKGATTYTPGTSDQTISSGTYLTGTQTISGDSNLVATNIKNGVPIFGVTGSYSGGASNVVTGTFKGTTTGAAMDVTLNYSGSGYPIAVLIYPSEGTYNSSGSFYSLIQRYAYITCLFVKNELNTVPTYNGGGTNVNTNNKALFLGRYKNSASNATTYSNTGSSNNAVYNDIDAAAANTAVLKVRSKTKLSVYIPSSGSDYGFAANIEYKYWVLYSS
jgi:hypothetical protein